MTATVWNLGWVIFSFTAAIFILYAVEARRRKKRKEELERQSSGYRLTERAAEYRLLWSKQILAAIDARCKEILQKAGADTIDEQVIQQAILEVAHNEWVKLSNRR